MRTCRVGAQLSGIFMLCVCAACDGGTLLVTTTPAVVRDDVPQPEGPLEVQIVVFSSLFCISALSVESDDGAVGGTFDGGAVFESVDRPSDVTSFEGLAARRYERA